MTSSKLNPSDKKDHNRVSCLPFVYPKPDPLHNGEEIVPKRHEKRPIYYGLEFLERAVSSKYHSREEPASFG